MIFSQSLQKYTYVITSVQGKQRHGHDKSNVMFYGSVRNHKFLSTILLKYVFVFTTFFRIKPEKGENLLEIKL